MSEKIEFKIEKGIPVAPLERPSSPSALYPWDQMQPGDSFAVPVLGKQKQVKGRFDSAMRARMKKIPAERYTTRIVKENNQLVLRIWRLEDVKAALAA